MNKGELLGKGMTSEVFSWGQNKVLKLFFENYNPAWVEHEAEVCRKIHSIGIPSPEVFDIVNVDNRKGIVFERISGKTLVEALAQEPWLFGRFVYEMANFQYRIHKHSVDGLPSQKEMFSRRIKSSSGVLRERTGKILGYLDKLPDGDRVCHGDFYLGNIMMRKKDMVAIDWSTCYKGNPASDVAITCLIINSPVVPPGIPALLSGISAYPRWMTYTAYLDEYLRLSKIKAEEVSAWMLPVAAARLTDKIPGEEKWLMEIIDKRLQGKQDIPGKLGQ